LFLDADDELIPQPAVIGMPPDADMLQFGMEEASIENQVKWHHLDPLEPQTGAQYLNRCFLGGHFFAPSLVYVYRLDWYRVSRLCYGNGLLHEDMLFTVQALLACGRLQRWPVPVYRYFRRQGSITSTENAEHQMRRLVSLGAIARELTGLAPSHRAVDLGWWTLFVMDYAGRVAAHGGGWRARWLTAVMELRFMPSIGSGHRSGLGSPSDIARVSAWRACCPNAAEMLADSGLLSRRPAFLFWSCPPGRASVNLCWGGGAASLLPLQ
jgi:hypothetical protein